jgi:hypothetical protein
VRYFATASGPKVREAMAAGKLGQIVTPAAGNRVGEGDWIGDNSVFGGHYPGDATYLAWLATRTPHAARCRFVAAPDVVGDAEATLARSGPMLPRIRALGFRVALVAQNGLEDLRPVPWNDFDCLFIGGSTEWKLGPAARSLVAEAKAQGKWVHMGRVNSLKRLRYAAAIGCDSADGTYLAFGPDRNLPTLLGWLRELDWPTLFGTPEGVA